MKTMLYAFAKRLEKAGWTTDGKGHWSNGKAEDVWLDEAGNYEFGVWRVQEDPKHVRKEMEAAGVVKGK